MKTGRKINRQGQDVIIDFSFSKEVLCLCTFERRDVLLKWSCLVWSHNKSTRSACNFYHLKEDSCFNKTTNQKNEQRKEIVLGMPFINIYGKLHGSINFSFNALSLCLTHSLSFLWSVVNFIFLLVFFFHASLSYFSAVVGTLRAVSQDILRKILLPGPVWRCCSLQTKTVVFSWPSTAERRHWDGMETSLKRWDVMFCPVISGLCIQWWLLEFAGFSHVKLSESLRCPSVFIQQLYRVSSDEFMKWSRLKTLSPVWSRCK